MADQAVETISTSNELLKTIPTSAEAVTSVPATRSPLPTLDDCMCTWDKFYKENDNAHAHFWNLMEMHTPANMLMIMRGSAVLKYSA